jgi:peptide/nickel transport system substrate-binding protein
MSQSGSAHGFSATFEFPSGNPAFQSLAAVLQSEWAALGVKLTLRPEDGATLNKNFTGGTYDLMIPYPNATADVPVPDEMAGLYGVPGPTSGFHSAWSDPTIATMLTKFTQTPDDASRAQQWPKIQAAMKDALPALNVLDLPLIKARASNVCGDVTSPIGYDTLLTAWVAK